MIDVLFEQRVIQNTALGAEVIWVAVSEAYEIQGRTRGIPMPLAYLILPMAFHRQSAHALATKQRPGALYRAISEDNDVVFGLQDRMEA